MDTSIVRDDDTDDDNAAANDDSLLESPILKMKLPKEDNVKAKRAPAIANLLDESDTSAIENLSSEKISEKM